MNINMLLKKIAIVLVTVGVSVICFSSVDNTEIKADSLTNTSVDSVVKEINELNETLKEQSSKEPNVQAIKLTFKKVPTLKVTKNNLVTPVQLVSKLKDIKVNHGKIQRFDFLMTNYYKKNSGKLSAIKVNKLHKGDKGVLTMVVQIGGLKPGKKYTFLNSEWPEYDLDWKTSKANKKGKLPLSSYSAVKVPFVIKK
ncbi:hypothetical protein QU408_06760 [Lactobacillus crispatus]|uniref:hypothetical protein n=1 Tax=Lactobacillus crispatus TaxID=47770 RepID=UPI003D6BD0F4